MKHKHFVFAVLMSGFAMSMVACGGEKDEAAGENNDSTQTAETKTEEKTVPAQIIAVNKAFTVVRHSDFTSSPETAEVTVLNVTVPYADLKMLEFVPDGQKILKVDLSIKNVNKEVPYSMTAGEITMVYKDSTISDVDNCTEAFKKTPEYWDGILDLSKVPVGESVKKTLFYRLPVNADLTGVKIQATSHLKGDKEEIVGVNIQ